MELDELLAQYAVHGRYVASMGPERVVHGGEHYLFLLAL